jgi:hypothetical protein
MDCRTARLLLDLVRPDGAELDGEEARALDQHLEDCPDCAASARAERGFHQQVGLAMKQVALPPDLHGRLVARLDKERGDYYRKQAARVFRTAAAVAACLLIGVIIWRMRTPEKPRFDVPLFLAQFEGNRCEARSKEAVEQWFHEYHGIEITAPSNFDYAFLYECGLADCKGIKVPYLEFARPGPEQRLVARVFIVDETQFDPRSLEQQESINAAGGAKAKIWRPAGSKFTYVILHNGEKLDPFLEENPAPAT